MILLVRLTNSFSLEEHVEKAPHMAEPGRRKRLEREISVNRPKNGSREDKEGSFWLGGVRVGAIRTTDCTEMGPECRCTARDADPNI